jgi:hypothetical protein
MHQLKSKIMINKTANTLITHASSFYLAVKEYQKKTEKVRDAKEAIMRLDLKIKNNK